jgi:hypothetical protein
MGRANLLPGNKQCLHVKSSETNTTMHVPQIEPNHAYKYVGLHIALNGNMITQIQNLQEKCNKINSAMSQVYMSAQDTKQGFTTVFIPSIRYALPTTSILQKTLTNMQKPIINTVLTKLGYNRHMPRALTFAPTSIGGIGILDLYTEQGTGKILMILTHLRSQSPIEQTILILLEHNIIVHNYVHSPWVQATKTFLNSVRGQIYIPTLNTIKIIRNNDLAIMESPNIQRFTKSQLEAINACRIYLQITTLAEISDEAGTHLLQIAVKGKLNPNKSEPLLWQISRSKLQWPYQLRPPSAAWNLWKRLLLSFTNNTPALQLTTPLGNWIDTVHNQRKWSYQYYEENILQTTIPYRYYTKIPNRHHQQTFQLQRQTAVVLNNNSTPAIPFHITNMNQHILIKYYTNHYTPHYVNQQIYNTTIMNNWKM